MSDTIRGLDQPAKVWRASAAELYGQPPPALDIRFGSLDALHDMRIRVRDELASLPDGDPRRHVRPWVWRWEKPRAQLTDTGCVDCD